MKCGKNGKIDDRVQTMVFMGYAENHAIDCNRMWNTVSCKVTDSHDDTWLDHMNHQDNIMADIDMLQEIQISACEISKDTTLLSYCLDNILMIS